MKEVAVLSRHIPFAKLLNKLSEEDVFLRDCQLLNEYEAPEGSLLCSQERTSGFCPESGDLFISRKYATAGMRGIESR
jgi:hypothetical protein